MFFDAESHETKKPVRIVSYILETVIFAGLAAVLIFCAWKVTERKESLVKNSDFFTEAENGTLDVLFIGSSHVINGVNPLRLYDKYGIPSYNLGGHGSLMQSSYWELKLAEEYVKPKIAVIDVYMLEKDYRYLDRPDDNVDKNTNVRLLHLNMDAFPYTETKKAAIEDLIKNKEIQQEFLWDFTVYHDRWVELTGDDFAILTGKMTGNRMMGAEEINGVKFNLSRTEIDDYGAELADKTVGVKYLIKFIKECRDNDIIPVVTSIPFNKMSWDQESANTARRIAEDKGAYFMELPDDVIDLATDLNDDGHLNGFGMDKVTDAIGEWLLANVELTDHRGDAAYDSVWKSRYTELQSDAAASVLIGEEELSSELEELARMVRDRREPGIILYINGGSGVYRDQGMVHLIASIADSDTIYRAQQEDREGFSPYVLIIDPYTIYGGGAGSGINGPLEACGSETIESAATAMGTITYRPGSELFRMLYIGDDLYSNLLYDDSHIDYDIRLILYDPVSGEVLTTLYYDSEGESYSKQR